MNNRPWTTPVVAVLIATVSFIGYADAPLPDASGDLTDHYRRMMIYHERMDANVPDGAVLFIGDSITQGLCVAAVHAHGVNYGIGSDTTVGVLHRLSRYSSMERAAAVVLAIGVNDLRRRDDDAILENMQAIIAYITARAPLVISAVLPLDERVETVGPERNERIQALNAALARLCAEVEHCAFVDAGPMLVAPDGNLSQAYHVGDGVHPNTAGYTHWVAVLQAGLANVQSAPDQEIPDQKE